MGWEWTFANISLVVTTIGTVVLAVFTGLLWDSTRKLWQESERTRAATSRSAHAAHDAADAAKKTAWVMERTSEAQLRAYVGVRRGKFRLVTDPATGNDHLRAEMTIVNSGQSTAYNVRLAMRAEIFTDPGETDYPVDLAPGSTYLVSGAEWNVRRTLGLVVTDVVKAQLSHGGRVALLWGTIAYVDAFENERASTFRFKHGARLDSAVLEWDVEPLPEGNVAS